MNKEEYEHYKFQEAMNQQQIDAQSAQLAPQIFEQVQQQQAILVEQTNPRKIINDIIMRLKGYDKLPNGNTVKVSEPMLNQEGLENIRFLLHSHINDNVRLSHLNNTEIGKRMDILSSDLVDSLRLNFHKWGIRNKTHLDDINNAVLCNVFDILKRAEGQNEKNWLGKISLENISGGSRLPQQQKEGFWSKFKL